ncbi:DUF6194 family protein [Streptomyces sp. NPDC059743]|uniref:DUF6194 family protein n=1 Tax=Streptomyces sp. NPDC059743 TaxID=3346928 RepID=UPI00364BDDA4
MTYLLNRASGEISWGDTFFYYAPAGVTPKTAQPFVTIVTIVTKNYPGDESSRLECPVRVSHCRKVTDEIRPPPGSAITSHSHRSSTPCTQDSPRNGGGGPRWWAVRPSDQ